MRRLLFAQRMQSRLLVVALAFLPLILAASEGGGASSRAVEIDLSNRAALQRGAKVYVNYCVGCHSAKFMRYQRLADDLGLTGAQAQENLILADGKLGDPMSVSMRPDDAARWFGVKPPDLSVVARSRGEQWLFDYLRGFYLDPKKPWGVNNTVFPDVSMPNVLVHLQGEQALVNAERRTLELVTPGTLDVEAYDALVTDLVSFLVYVGEPAKLVRYGLGAKVILFLLAFTLFAWLLKREMWKDIH